MQSNVDRLLEVVKRLRGPGGCPWDQKQTHDSLKPLLIEECYEVLEAIDEGDEAHLTEELGDVLLHVAMHAEIASENGGNGFEEIAGQLTEKLIRRHPHVFGDAEAENPEEVLGIWEAVKKKEKASRTSAIDGVPKHFPALIRAQKVGHKASKVGFDWKESGPVLEKIREELKEVEVEITGNDAARLTEEIGDVLFSVVNLARKLQVNAEAALQEATDKFSERFRKVEALATERGIALQDAPLEELDRLWEESKQAGKI